MENIFEKLGIYDLFGLLIPGMFFLGYLLVVDCPVLGFFNAPQAGAIQGILFIVFGYILGSLIQEMASFMEEKKLFSFGREGAYEEYLLDSKLNEKEKEKIREEVYNLKGKGDEKKEKQISPTPLECKNAFFICKAQLENQGKMDKADRYDGIYCMSRNLLVCNLMILIELLVCGLLSDSFQCGQTVAVLIYCIGSSLFFAHKANRYCGMRVRTILRQYMDLKNENEKT